MSAKLEADRSTEFPRGHPLLGGRADNISAFAFSFPPWQAVREQACLGGDTGYNCIGFSLCLSIKVHPPWNGANI